MEEEKEIKKYSCKNCDCEPICDQCEKEINKELFCIYIDLGDGNYTERHFCFNCLDKFKTEVVSKNI